MKDASSQLEFEDSLRIRDIVLARWTNSHRFYQGEAVVVRVNEMTVRIKLTAPPGHPKWSENNRVGSLQELEGSGKPVAFMSTAPI